MAESAEVTVPPPSSDNTPEKACGSCGKSISIKAEICPGCGLPQRTPVDKTRLLLLTFFLGGFGAHKFYLRRYWQGALYLIICWSYLPALAALVEFIGYAFTSSAQLNEMYFTKRSPRTVFIVETTALLLLIVYFVVVLTISEQDYEKRGKLTEGIVMGSSLKNKITEAFSQRPSDMSCTPEACPFGVSGLGPTEYVRRVYSDKTGIIVIEYDEQFLHKSQNRLSLRPLIDGQSADLSDPANAGKDLTWQCGNDRITTVLPQFLPGQCR